MDVYHTTIPVVSIYFIRINNCCWISAAHHSIQQAIPVSICSSPHVDDKHTHLRRKGKSVIIGKTGSTVSISLFNIHRKTRERGGKQQVLLLGCYITSGVDVSSVRLYRRLWDRQAGRDTKNTCCYYYTVGRDQQGQRPMWNYVHKLKVYTEKVLKQPSRIALKYN